MIASLAQHFGWEPGFWRKLGWIELRNWLAAMNRQREAQQTDPDSWEGSENDPGWVELRRKAAQARGR